MLKTVNLALRTLKMFDDQNSTWGGRELAHEMGVNHTSLYRILETLENNDFVRKDFETKRYSLGPAVWELGMRYYSQLNIEKVLRPLLDELCHLTGESVFFTVLNKNEGLTLMVSEPENKVKFSVSEGSTAPLYVGASYRAISAFLPEEQQDEIIGGELTQYTANTLVDAGDLKKELQKIRDNSWSLSQGEYTPDVNAIAVPVFVHKEVIGSLTISGPMYRFSEAHCMEVLPALKDLSDTFSSILTINNIEI
ncbi:IclR family transcriptional regulator [Sporosarcina ureilytica]|uniref:IclR family transcriptional regulator n=1 Tax=Sporosarcina ureilytica TaxID=298596 RepID=A0A1D8JJ38_9BACL|nr:IclR family transcriptional regulator [Sporosarcina ureilytica]AOV08719.1 IclR family transcriptional regulator [Sporosarcina ureilytica]